MIAGYRALNTDEVSLINEIKAKGDSLGVLIQLLRNYNRNEDGGVITRRNELDHRWISIGETHLQQGLMALVRAVAQPTNF